MTDAIPPTTRKELRSFLGLAPYYCRFIPGLAKITRMLNEEMSGNVKFVCSGDIQTALEELKVKLTSAPVPAYPDHEKPFVVCTDASSKAVGAVLFKLMRTLEIILYITRAGLYILQIQIILHLKEKHWASFCIEKFRHYLTSNRFKLYKGQQALKYAFNMKDPHGRIARWFTLLAEYDFEICYRARRDKACTAIFSRPVELMVIDDHQPSEANLKAIAHYLDNLSVMDQSISITQEVKNKAKDFLIQDERLFRRTKYGIRFVTHIEMRASILNRLHDEVGHWDFNSTYTFVRDRFRWPNMRKEVEKLLKSCVTCRKTRPVNRKELAGRIPISGILHTWCIDFARPLPRTNTGNQ